MKRLSTAFERDWAFYTANAAAFDFSGSYPPDVVHDPAGPNAKRAFHAYDSRGVLQATSEPDLLRRVLVCKASVNLHVRMWAEGVVDGTMLPSDFAQIQQDMSPPPWLFEAVERQAQRLRANRHARAGMMPPRQHDRR
jgi:hypothetical protein